MYGGGQRRKETNLIHSMEVTIPIFPFVTLTSTHTYTTPVHRQPTPPENRGEVAKRTKRCVGGNE